jgi:hypothetical protein
MAKSKKWDTPPSGAGRSYPLKPSKFVFAENSKEVDFSYTTPGPYCKVKRLNLGRCATQLNFVDGKPVLRMCGAYGAPGEVVSVSGPEDAQRKASKFCLSKFGRDAGSDEDEDEGDAQLEAVWPMQVIELRTGKKYTENVEADSPAEAYLEVTKSKRVERSRQTQGDVAVAPPGYRWTPQGWKKTLNPAWLGAGVAMGVMAAYFIKKNASA